MLFFFKARYVTTVAHKTDYKMVAWKNYEWFEDKKSPFPRQGGILVHFELLVGPVEVKH